MAEGRFGIEIIEGKAVLALQDRLAILCQAVFPAFDPNYLRDRLPHVLEPALILASDSERIPVAFKLGYRRGKDLFYSWLGGVHPLWQRRGIARALMEAQHDWARTRGYRSIETRTRAANSPMIILNLTSGFVITGFEVDKAGHPVVTQRCML